MSEWREAWPDDPDTWWWLYGRAWGDTAPKLYPVQIRRIANGVARIASGHCLFPSDIERVGAVDAGRDAGSSGGAVQRK